MTHKRFLVLPVFLTGALLLTGCGATQVRDRAYVQGIELSRIAEPSISTTFPPNLPYPPAPAAPWRQRWHRRRFRLERHCFWGTWN